MPSTKPSKTRSKRATRLKFSTRDFNEMVRGDYPVDHSHDPAIVNLAMIEIDPISYSNVIDHDRFITRTEPSLDEEESIRTQIMVFARDTDYKYRMGL